MLQNRLAKLREERANRDDGFTLIELLVVVVIIGILIAIAIPVYLNYTNGAKDKSADSDLRGAVSTLEQCNSNLNAYPATLTAPGTVTSAYQVTACTGPTETLSFSSGTTFKYYPSATKTAYLMETQNTSGSKVIYCYSSTTGGGVKQTKATTLITSYGGGTCPA